jgi:hypothetical protein
MTISVSKVEDTMPPIIGTAIRCFTSTPVPCLRSAWRTVERIFGRPPLLWGCGGDHDVVPPASRRCGHQHRQIERALIDPTQSSVRLAEHLAKKSRPSVRRSPSVKTRRA